MALTPEQSQMLQMFMQKNRIVPQGSPAQMVQPMQIPRQASGGGSSLLSAIGGLFDTPATQGPVRTGDMPLPGAQQSQLSQFANMIKPDQQPQLLKNLLIKMGMV